MEWISVEDQIPEEGIQVLTLDTRTHNVEYRLDYIVLFEYETKGYIWACRLQDEMHEVTYWMPLPDPPKTEEDIHRPLKDIFKRNALPISSL